MEFAVAESADRTFEDLCAQLRDEPVEALQAAAGSRATHLQAEAGPLVLVGPEVAVLHVAWRDRASRLRLEAELRIVGVNRGAEPVTELLMIGHWSPSGPERSGILAWAREVLMELADRPRSGVRAVGSTRPGGNGRSRWPQVS